MSKQTEALTKEISTLTVTTNLNTNLITKKLYSEEVQAELAELQSDINVLLQQLQSLSSQRLTAVGSAS
jgi:hypothetical protein